MISMNLSEVASHTGARLCGEDVRFSGCSIDSRRIMPGEMFIALRGARHDGHDFAEAAVHSGAVCVMLEETRSLSVPAVEVDDAVTALGELALAWRRRFSLPCIAVTGSNGKTTVKEMLGSILRQCAPVLLTPGNQNNRIGVPLALFTLTEEHRYAVMEMGANMAGEIRSLTRICQPAVAVITQCAPAHLQGFGSIDEVAAAKAEIYTGLGTGGTVVINSDDRYADWWARQCAGKKQLRFGLGDGAEIRASDVCVDPGTLCPEFSLHIGAEQARVRLALLGRHNVMNALAAAACAYAVEVPLGRIVAGLEQTRPPAARLCLRRGRDGGLIIDDTYNANPESLRVALCVFADCAAPRWLVLGDMKELGTLSAEFHAKAAAEAVKCGVSRLYALGTETAHTVDAFPEWGRHFPGHRELAEALSQDVAMQCERDGSAPSILFKGSRGMCMERVLAPLCAEED